MNGLFYLVYTLQLRMEEQPHHYGQGMEPEMKLFLKKILNSVSVGLIWLLINMTAGLFWGYAHINGKLSTKNIAFYSWMLISLALLIFYLVKVWRKK